MKATIITFIFSLVLSVANAAENVIHLQDEQVSLRCPPSWVIIMHKLRCPPSWTLVGHKIGVPSDVIVFNPGDDGSDNSAFVAVVAWDLRETGAMLKFTQAILEHEKQKHTVTKVGEWAINTWNPKPSSEMRDCYRTAKPFGILVRLGIPKLPETTKEWSDKLETDLKKLLESITVEASK